MSRQATLERLSRTAPTIAPSMLKCDFGALAEEVSRLDRAGSDVLHWDVMDGHFVPNLSYGAMLFAPIRERTQQIFDVHLMISEPERYLDDYLRVGSDCITFHYEAVSDASSLLSTIIAADCVAGLAINPGTSIEAVEPLLDECDLILVMSVEPGFGGQKFIPVAIEKLHRLRELGRKELILSVDGGIGPETIGSCARAGADLFVAGSSIFETDDYSAAIDRMRSLANEGRSSMSC